MNIPPPKSGKLNKVPKLLESKQPVRSWIESWSEQEWCQKWVGSKHCYIPHQERTHDEVGSCLTCEKQAECSRPFHHATRNKQHRERKNKKPLQGHQKQNLRHLPAHSPFPQRTHQHLLTSKNHPKMPSSPQTSGSTPEPPKIIFIIGTLPLPLPLCPLPNLTTFSRSHRRRQRHPQYLACSPIPAYLSPLRRRLHALVPRFRCIRHFPSHGRSASAKR